MTNDQQDISRILRGIHADPFAYLGCHEDGSDLVIRAYVPHAQTVAIVKPRGTKTVADCARLHEGGIFEARVKSSKLSSGYQLIANYDGTEHRYDDPYRFAPDLGELDLHLLSEGSHVHAFKSMQFETRTVTCSPSRLTPSALALKCGPNQRRSYEICRPINGETQSG